MKRGEVYLEWEGGRQGGRKEKRGEVGNVERKY